jgi:hypothetical protein
MNSTQLIQQVAAGLQQQNWLLLGCIALVILVSAAGMLGHLFIAKRIEARIANQQHFNRVQFEQEAALYREIWKKLCDFYEKSFATFAWNDSTDESELTTLRKVGEDFFDTIRNNRPFYPEEVWKDLREFIDICDRMSGIHRAMRRAAASAMPQFREPMENAQRAAKEQSKKIEESIRRRLAHLTGGVR